MNIQQGQLRDLQKINSAAQYENSNVLAEAGNDNGETFKGTFLAEVKTGRSKNVYRFEDGKMIKKVK